MYVTQCDGQSRRSIFFYWAELLSKFPIVVMVIPLQKPNLQLHYKHRYVLRTTEE